MNETAIIRNRGQLTIPDNIRKSLVWVAPLSAVIISVVKPDEIVIRPHKTKLNMSDIWQKINSSRAIKGSGKISARDLLIKDRLR